MSQHSRVSKLLVIDDDVDAVRLIEVALGKNQGARLEIESLLDSSDALKRISQGGVDILLTDLDMPNIDGTELLRVARQVNPCCQVILITGQSTSSDLLTAVVGGASDYLLKPLDGDLLRQLVGEALERGMRWRRALAGTWESKRLTASV